MVLLTIHTVSAHAAAHAWLCCCAYISDGASQRTDKPLRDLVLSHLPWSHHTGMIKQKLGAALLPGASA